ncbi:hypothetical protein DUNSADRAFT_17391 [Dunaliella salina]|uniref:Glycosyltransferase 61 catalytic domain-containing protein n=1 Tax=Dunaliella salina TaxID=3046 RepID=A0ABQ7G1U1_DUNSA|nr:hypothetical protein DUNSADRAFT_17391 [Dunaliella salina]|eukprot:KAF5828576.1 hypothetical protein DUNSADRAFT_17391 [Dunaliella salina]
MLERENVNVIGHVFLLCFVATIYMNSRPACAKYLYLEDVVFERGIIKTRSQPKLSHWHLERSDINFTIRHTMTSPFCRNWKEETAVFAIAWNFPQYGHTLFNFVSNVFATASEFNITKQQLILYVMKTGGYKGPPSAFEVNGRFVAGQYEPILKELCKELLSLKAVLDSPKKFCFRRLVLGLSTSIDHYSLRKKNLKLFRRFAELMKLVYGVVHVDSCVARAIIINRNDRRILNINELASALSSRLHRSSMCVNVTDFSKISIPVQISLMKTTSLLVGIDGTGLINAAFLPYPCGAMIHLRTFGTSTLKPRKGSNFRALALFGAGLYYAWENSDFSSAVFHSQVPRKIIQLLRRGQVSPLQDQTFTSRQKGTTILRQDTNVSISDVLILADRARHEIIRCNASKLLVRNDSPLPLHDTSA